MALCHGLDRFSDHRVEHEPDQPLEEAWHRHLGKPGSIPNWKERLTAEEGSRYGLSWRAPNLLADVRDAAPRASVLVIVRDPIEYVLSAHSKRVLSKGTAWDRFRLMPSGVETDDLPLAQQIAWHWRTVNEYLLDFAADDRRSRVVLFDQPLDNVVEDWARSLGVRITDPDGLRKFLRERPNAGPRDTPPTGFSRDVVEEIGSAVWARAATLNS
jgi:hypothetical protein